MYLHEIIGSHNYMMLYDVHYPLRIASLAATYNTNMYLGRVKVIDCI